MSGRRCTWAGCRAWAMAAGPARRQQRCRAHATGLRAGRRWEGKAAHPERDGSERVVVVSAAEVAFVAGLSAALDAGPFAAEAAWARALILAALAEGDVGRRARGVFRGVRVLVELALKNYEL